MALPAPRCGCAKQDRKRSEHELVINLARYGFLSPEVFQSNITWMKRSKKSVRDDRLTGVNQLEQLARDHSVPAGKSSFLKHLFLRRENRKLEMSHKEALLQTQPSWHRHCHELSPARACCDIGVRVAMPCSTTADAWIVIQPHGTDSFPQVVSWM